MLCGSRQRSTSTGSPALDNKPLCFPFLPFPPELGPSGPHIVVQTWVVHHDVGALNNKPTFWPALFSPPELGRSEPLIVVQNRVVHHAVWFPLAQHVHKEPCFE